MRTPGGRENPTIWMNPGRCCSRQVWPHQSATQHLPEGLASPTGMSGMACLCADDGVYRISTERQYVLQKLTRQIAQRDGQLGHVASVGCICDGHFQDTDPFMPLIPNVLPGAV